MNEQTTSAIPEMLMVISLRTPDATRPTVRMHRCLFSPEWRNAYLAGVEAPLGTTLQFSEVELWSDVGDTVNEEMWECTVRPGLTPGWTPRMA